MDSDTQALISEGKMQDDCGDSGFTDINGATLKYFIDSSGGACNTDSTDYYVLVPQINPGSTVIFHYYGNPYSENSGQEVQFTEASFSPASLDAASEEVTPGPVSYWKMDEGYGEQSASGMEQQIEIMNEEYSTTFSEWYSSSWTKRASVTVTNNTASELTNYQVPVSITYDSDMQSDFRDLLFTSSSGTLLDYWIETQTNGVSATVWVEVDTIPASSSTTVQMYYGNSGVSSSSSFNNTFRSDSIFLTTSRNGYGHPNNHTQMDTMIDAMGTSGYAVDGSGYVTTIDHGSNPYGSSDYYISRYRFIYKADTTGTHYFGVNTDDAGEILLKDVGDTHTSHTVLASWYGGHGTGTCGSSGSVGSRSLNAGDIIFLEMRHEEWDGGNHAQACVQEPGGSYQVINTTNFANQIFSRTLSIGTEPSVAVGSEESYTEGASFMPTDNSLGIIYYDPANYNGETLYLDAVVSTDGTNWERKRSSAIENPTEAKEYTVRLRPGDGNSVSPAVQLYNITDNVSASEITFGEAANTTVYLKSARLIVLQSALSGVRNTQTQIETESNQISTSPDSPVGTAVSYWKFDEGYSNVAHDSSINKNDLNLSSTTWTNEGKFGKALDFESDTSSYASISDNSSLSITEDLTLSAWIKPESITADTLFPIAGKWEGANQSYLLAQYGNEIRFYLDAPENYIETTSASLSTETWYHILGRYNASSQSAQIFINGIAQSTTVSGILPSSIEDNSSAFRIGAADIISQSGGEATGGTITTIEGYVIHTFTSNGTFTPDENLSNVEVLVVAGGGGGGTNVGGGGGAGGVVYNANLSITPESPIAVTVGAGGAKDKNGGNSVFDTITAIGGGKGGMANQNGANGGSGGGAGRFSTGQGQGGTGTESQGYRGGNTLTGGGTGAAGGGGAGEQGVDWQASDAGKGTDGGDGVQYDISGTPTYYGGGGGGGPYGTGGGDGGLGGGGNGGEINGGSGYSGSPNTGGGGGGGSTGNGPGGSGGSGIVIVRYPSSSEETRYFDGLIDEIKIYNFALSEDQVKTDYNMGQTSLIGSFSTKSDATTSSLADSRLYCVPGDDSTCNVPRAEWTFEEGSGASAYDTSGNNNTGSLGGGTDDYKPAWINGKVGKALKFDGTNDIVSVSGLSTLGAQLSSPISISTWFKWTGGSNTAMRQLLGVLNTGATTGLVIDLHRNSNQDNEANATTFYLRDDSGDILSGHIESSTIYNGEWHYLTFVSNPAGASHKIYVDGKEQTVYYDNAGQKDVINNPTNFAYNLYIGAVNSQGTAVLHSPVELDNLRIYTYTRTPAQVAWEYNKGAPVGHWAFDECEGTSLHDSTGNNNTGTWYGTGDGQTSVGTCTTSGDTAWYNGRNGKLNASLNFDGDDDLVQVASSSKLNVEDFSLSTWVYFTDTYRRPILVKYNSNNDLDFELSTGSNNALFVNIRKGSVNNSTPAVPVSTDRWYHVAATFSGNNLRLYLDGTEVAAKTDMTLSPTQVGTVYIGHSPSWHGYGAYSFYGKIDETKIYPYALSAEQVKVDYNNGATIFK